MNDIIFNKINHILAMWNPLDVPEFLVYNEYVSYVSDLISTENDCSKIREELNKIIINKLELDYNDKRKLNEELDELVREISQAFNI